MSELGSVEEEVVLLEDELVLVVLVWLELMDGLMGGGSIAIISRSSCMCWAVSRVAVVRALLVSLVMSSRIPTRISGADCMCWAVVMVFGVAVVGVESLSLPIMRSSMLTVSSASDCMCWAVLVSRVAVAVVGVLFFSIMQSWIMILFYLCLYR